MSPIPTRARSGTEHIVVFRALPGLGDFLCAVPTLRAIRQRAPSATIHLVGLPGSEPLVERFSRYVDAFHAFPGLAGLPEQPAPPAAELDRFVDRIRAVEADLAIQLHGSGEVVNDFVLAFGARHVAGFHRPGTPAPTGGTFLEWLESEPEPLRGPRLLAALADPRRRATGGGGDGVLELPLAPRAGRRATILLADTRPGSYAVLHPGSARPESRWDPDGFAVAGRRIQAAGLRIVLTGDARDASLTRRLAAILPDSIDLGARTDLDELGAVVRAARFVLTNDTGMSHVAAALGVPSVVVFTNVGSDHIFRWAPLDTTRHRAVRGSEAAVLGAVERLLDVPARAA